MEAYYADNGSYASVDGTALASIDAGVKITVVGTQSASSYCIKNTQGGFTYYKHGPAGDITTTTACTGG